MSKILELRTKRNTLWEQTKDFLEKNRGENGLVKTEPWSSTTRWHRRSRTWVQRSSVWSSRHRSSTAVRTDFQSCPC